MRRSLVAFGLVVLVISAGCDGAATAVSRPSSSREGETWGHEELIAFLRRKGVQLEILRHPSGWGSFANTSVIKLADRYQVDVHLEKTSREAHDYTNDRGQRGYSWGKFCFIGDKSAIRILRQALES